MFNVFFGDIGNSIRMEANSFTHIPNTENSTVAAATNLDNAPNPTSPSPPVPSTPSLKAPSLHADSITPSSIQIVDVEASEPVQPISAVHSLRPSSTKRKNDKGKAVAVPVCSTLNLKISDSRKKNGEFEGSNLSKTKTSTFPRAKTQRILACILAYKDAMKKNHKLQEYIKKNRLHILKRSMNLKWRLNLVMSWITLLTLKKKVDKVEREVESEVESDEVCDHQLHNSYFKESDEFELEVESGHELDHELLDHELLDHELLDHELDHQLQEYIKKHNVLLWT